MFSGMSRYRLPVSDYANKFVRIPPKRLSQDRKYVPAERRAFLPPGPAHWRHVRAGCGSAVPRVGPGSDARHRQPRRRCRVRGTPGLLRLRRPPWRRSPPALVYGCDAHRGRGRAAPSLVNAAAAVRGLYPEERGRSRRRAGQDHSTHGTAARGARGPGSRMALHSRPRLSCARLPPRRGRGALRVRRQATGHAVYARKRLAPGRDGSRHRPLDGAGGATNHVRPCSTRTALCAA